MDIPST